MKFTAPRHELLTAIQAVLTATAPKQLKPILANVHISFSSCGLLKVTATDLEVGIIYKQTGVITDRSGVLLLPAHKLANILKESTDEEVTIYVHDDKATIRMKSGRYELPTADPMEFPVPELPTDLPKAELNSGAWESLVKRTIHAANRKDNSARFRVDGLYLDISDKAVTLVATDTKRLAVDVCKDNVSGLAEQVSALIPLKVLPLITKAMEEGERLGIVLRSNDAIFYTERATIHTKLVEGRFPQYQLFIPKKHDVKVNIDVEDFAQAIRQAAITADDESKRIDFHFTPGKLILAARGAETGSSEVVLDLPGSEVELSIAFDPVFLLDMLRSVGVTTMTLHMTYGSKPAVFRDGDYTFLVMPMGERE